ncbi:hypothetical protein N7486_004183 [Penicillium sp. IBT 16267x]|nr:hypothetical protein N7486_010093 [Penicillium sp. IBT 16267x]KAJ6103961.1 hypothetical protein N7486_004183 [Penicillium sp. IBT 16267x]
MPPPRSTIFLLSTPHNPSRASPHLRTRHSCSPFTHTTSKRPHPQNAQKLPQSRITFRAFNSTTPGYAQEQTHYETLGLPITASAAEIKKKFYALSLKHHPDRNRKDPEAGQRFARISAAYNVVGHASKRAIYDRDNGFHAQHHGHGHGVPHGSHSSHTAHPNKGGSYAGSRPASGLSKRRGTFHGPPPSFYDQGGYGATGRTGREGAYAGSSDEFGETRKKEDDPEDPMGFIYRNPLRHFNAQAHFKTQSAEDKRRIERRRKAKREAFKENGAVMASGNFQASEFFIVCGIFGVLIAIGGFFRNPLPPTSAPNDGAGRRKEGRGS